MGGPVVFSNIADNIKSFFRKEEELERNPQKLPDAAVEVFEKPGQHTIVASDRKLPTQSERPREQKLPFSAAELRAAHARQQKPRSEPEPKPASDEEITRQIAEFEAQIGSMPGEDGSSVPISPPQKTQPKEEGLLLREFASFLKERGYDESAIPEDLVDRLRRHHKDRIVRERHSDKAVTLEQAVSKKLAQLQELERDWARKQEEIVVAEERMAELEEHISSATVELRELVGQVRHHADLAPNRAEGQGLRHGQYFRLEDGRMITSLADLRHALLSMDDALFSRHVTTERNDFSTWIRDVFEDSALAKKVGLSRNRFELARLLEAEDR